MYTTNQNYQIEFPHISRLVLMLFCGYVFTWLLQIGYRIPILGNMRFEFCYAVVIIVCGIILTPRLHLNGELLSMVMLFLFVIILQIPFSYDSSTSWEVFIDRTVKFAFMAFFIVCFVRSPSHMKYFLAAFLLACIKMGGEGLIGKITGGMMWENQGIMRLHGSTPIYTHPNSFAGMALGTLPFVYFLWNISNRYIKCALFILGILSLNIIVFSGSRTSYLGLLIFILYVIFNSSNKKTVIVVVISLSALGTVFIPKEYNERFQSIYTLQEKEGKSGEARIQILKDAWSIFKDNPLGIGVAAFPKKRFDTFGRVQDTHNLYLEIATNLGVQGLVVFFLLIVKLFRMLKDITQIAQKNIVELSSNTKTDILLKYFAFIRNVASAIGGYLIIRLSLGLFGMDLYEVYWWIVIGITFSLDSMVRLLNSRLPASSDSVSV